ncbi:MAG: amidohydrolase family protein [Terracidiphilus sp.]
MGRRAVARNAASLCYTPRMRLFAAVFAVALAGASVCLAQAPTSGSEAARTLTPAPSRNSPPDVVFFNGVIYTGEGFGNDKPQTVEAMAIGAGKVLSIGSNAQIKRLAGAKTQMRDLKASGTGVFVFPGFDDAHVHLGMAARTKLNVDLRGLQSLSAMLVRIETYAEDAPPGHWLTGGGWDHTLWPEKVLPTRQQLDEFTAGHPAFLQRIDGHIAIANTAALKAAGITGKTVPPQGGAIDLIANGLDAHGEPTGILRESAQELVARVIPPPSHDERMRGDELAIADALAHGVTSVQDFSDWEDFLVFEELEEGGKLNLRISEWLPFVASLDELKRMRAYHDLNDPMLHTGMLKGFMDGSLGSRTAALKAPYADDPGNMGLPQFKQEQLNQMAAARARSGFQLGFHAIGDEAVSMALDAFSQPGVSKTARNRIEHAQVVDPADIPRFAKLGVIASMQPSHLLTDMSWAEARLGPKRAAYSYAWKAFLDADVPLAFGTDYPVEPITPFRGLYSAVTRMNEAGTKSYFLEEKITRGRALYAYTQGSAYAEFAENRKGKLAPGFDADFILVDRDLYKAPAPDLLKARVLETFVAGQQVYLAGVGIR